MLDFDYIASRPTASVAAIVTPGAAPGAFQKAFFGDRELAIPVYPSVGKAAAAHPAADVAVNFSSYRSAYASSVDAVRNAPTVRTIVIIAEGVPERDARMLFRAAKEQNKIIIGPATVGGILAGGFRIGDTAGTIENIIGCNLHRPGGVGFVSKSGGMSNEMYNVIGRVAGGVYEGIAVGGDAYAGSTIVDHVRRFECMDEIGMIVVLGELGGNDEYGVVEALRSGDVKKPVVAWVTGTCAKWFKTSEVQFGHAGARSGGDADESAEAKNTALKEAGAVVPDSFEGMADAIKVVYDKLVKEGKMKVPKEVEARPLPQDVGKAIKTGKVRKATNIVCSISDDRGEEPAYCGVSFERFPVFFCLTSVLT